MKNILVSVMLLIAFSAGAQKVSFDYLGLKDGLSQITVTTMLQDSIGRIWIGTRDGLNVYDGAQIKTFRPVRGDANSLLGHNVRDLKRDGDYLWASTYAGVSRLDISRLEFQQYPFDGILSILPFEGNLLVGTNRGLFELNRQHETFTLKAEVFKENTAINELYLDNAGMVWICSDKGLYKYNHKRKVTTPILTGKINTVFTDSKKQIWVGSNGQGVYLLNQHHQVVKHFRHQEDDSYLVNDIIRDINEDSKGSIWVGTFLGLSIIDGRQHTITNYRQTDEGRKTLSHNSVYSILRDHQGTMWVGTYFGAISYYNPDFQIYQEYEVKADHPEGIGYRVVGKMIEDERNNLWIATEGGGLDYFDRKNKIFRHYNYKEGKAGLSHNNVKSLLMVNKNTLFIGTHMGGFNILDLESGQFKNFFQNAEDTTSLPSGVITDIIPFHGDYLLGTHEGVIQFNPVTQQFSPFFRDAETRAYIGKVIYCLFEDSFGKLWIGTEKNGLCSYDIQSRKLNRYQYKADDLHAISSNTIYTIFEDHQFRLWIGTFGGGLNQYIRENDHFINYSRATHQLPSDFVYGIQESRYGNLWVATGKGLSRFDIENNRFYNYDRHNGFPLEELNEGSLYVTSDGEVFVGGINGLISFKEEDILKKSNDYNLLMSALWVNNKKVYPGDKTGILKNDLPYTRSIVLEPDQNIFTLHYSACNFISTNQSRYQYQLEGFNPDWVDAGEQTSVTYTNLDPGTYTLKIRSLNGLENSVVDEKVLHITVNPPIYKTWYAYVFYFLMLLAIIWWLNQIYLSKVRLVDNLKAEQREKEQIKELNQSKLRFFTNISHEFRTPLTLITGTLESILEDTKTSARNYRKLLTINNNANRLNNLITELLDFRKLEQGFLKLRVTEYKLGEFIDEIFQSFVEYAHYHQVEYSFKSPPESLALWFDKSQMEKVFYNLISNAFKVVDERIGQVTLEVIEQPGYVDIIVSDNGPGMAPDKVSKIFDRFYQIDRVNGKTRGQGSGIGLALCKGIIAEHDGQILVTSQEGEGTSFTVRLKKGNKHYTEEQLTPVEEVVQSIEPPVILLANDSEDIEPNELPEDAPTILLVEDNTEARHLLVDIFRNSYKLIEAEDGSEGLKAALEHQPDLIISDVMMPNMSGTEMCAKIKRNVQTSHIPVVLLTARTALEYKIEGIETGADDYLTKPYNIRLLRTRVKNLLQNRAIMQQKFKQDPQAEIKEVATNTLDRKMLEQARDIIEKQIDNTEFDVNDFAREMGLGRTRLYAKIKGVTGQTPNEFILSTRLKKSADMLMINPEMNVSEIAYAVGFSTPRYFSRCFREHFGVSPSKYGIRQSDNEETENDESNNDDE
jgi:signal transduction histidine kinase/ligand-binding sensor domain-containing protein/DNA-binding response OmpR family regulator